MASKISGHLGTSLLPPYSCSPKPFNSSRTHRLFFAIFKPRHEGSVEYELVTAFGVEETPHVLGVAIGLCNLRPARDFVAMPIKRYHTAPPDRIAGYTKHLPCPT